MPAPVSGGIREFYDRFRLEQLHLVDEGLFRGSDGVYHLVVPGVTDATLAASGRLLAQWVRANTLMFCTIDVVELADLLYRPKH